MVLYSAKHLNMCIAFSKSENWVERTDEPTCMFKKGPLLISLLKQELMSLKRNWTVFSVFEDFNN